MPDPPDGPAVRAWNGWHNDPSADPETLANNAIAELQATVKRLETEIEKCEWAGTHDLIDGEVVHRPAWVKKRILADLAKRVEEEDHD